MKGILLLYNYFLGGVDVSSLTDLVPVPPGINPGLNGVSNRLALSVLGNPRSTYSSNCQPVTNPSLKPRMVTDNVGPFRVTGLDKAVESLKLIMSDIKTEQPAVFAVLGTAGMLCSRLVRGSNHSISNHSWGLAHDFTIEGVLDQRGDGKVQFGLTFIAPMIQLSSMVLGCWLSNRGWHAFRSE